MAQAAASAETKEKPCLGGVSADQMIPELDRDRPVPASWALVSYVASRALSGGLIGLVGMNALGRDCFCLVGGHESESLRLGIMACSPFAAGLLCNYASWAPLTL